MTEPSSLDMVLLSSATLSARCLVQVKGHLVVAQTGYMAMFHSTICGHSSSRRGGKCELGCCLHLVKAAVWPFLLGVSSTVGLVRTLGLTSQRIPKLCSMVVADHLRLLSSEHGLQPLRVFADTLLIHQRW